jgi:hypothetical protein
MPPASIERLLALYAECSAGGEYEAAYHVLMAALHLADHAGDAGALGRISDAAGSLEQDIEAVEPPHALSAAAAERRGQQPLCHSLRVHIEAVRLRMRSDGQLLRRSAPPA